MTDVTRVLADIEAGDPTAGQRLLPLVYDELRKLAGARMAQERPGHTLQATALVHEAYLRLVDATKIQRWESRGHFFAAAAEAMRRILVEAARRKQSAKRGGRQRQLELQEADLAIEHPTVDIVMVSDAIDCLRKQDPAAAEIASLRIFAGLSIDEAGQALGIPHTTAYRQWTFAQAWLAAQLRTSD